MKPAPASVTLLVLFTLVGLGLQVYFFTQDHRPLTYDDAWHFETSLRLYNALEEEGFLGFIAAYLEAFRVKGPLIAAAPIPLYAALGSGVDSALLVNCIFLILINIYLYKLVALWCDSSVALSSVVIFQTMPVAVGLSRAFMTEYGLAALVIMFMYYLERANGLRDPKASGTLGLVAGFGLLMKINFLIVVVPLLIDRVYRTRFRPEKDDQAAPTVPVWGSSVWFAAAVVLVAGPWFFVNAGNMVSFTWDVSLGRIGNYQVAGLGLWLRDAVQVAVSSYYGISAAALALAMLILWRGKPQLKRWHVMMAGWFGPGMAAAAVGMHEDYRYILVVLPPVAIFIAAGLKQVLDSLRRSAYPFALVAFFVFPCLTYGMHTFGSWVSGSIRLGPVLFFQPRMSWARPPDSLGAWNQREVAQQVARLCAQIQRESCEVVVGVEHAFFNNNTLNYLSLLDGRDIRSGPLG